MDSKGIYSIDFIFSIFLILIISVSVFGFINSDLENRKVVEENINGRILVDNIANTINQVNSNNIGHIQEIDVPNNISGKYFFITIKQNEVILSFDGKKAESAIFPIKMISIGENPIEEIKLYPSEKYEIRKCIDSNNMAKIQIYKI